MRKIIIAAVALNNVIGNKNKMPWNNRDEIKYFKETTINNAVLMGRNTFDSIGKPLTDRVNLVVSKKKYYDKVAEKLYYFTSIKDAYKFAENLNIDKLFIIGGSEIFSQTINNVDELLVSRIPLVAEGNKYFPSISNDVWKLTETQNFTSFSVERYLRIKSKK